MAVQPTVRIQVHYIGAGKPFIDDAAARSETVGELKARVLAVFGLAEGATPEGNQVLYHLYHEKQRLDDLSQTLGELAGDHHDLNLKLAQEVIQGDGG